MASQRDSVAQLRYKLRDLDGQRQAIEEEIALLSERLNAPGQPGIKGSLLDKQGFPRADIDIVQVRRDRQRLICLSNDQKALTDKLARLLGELHQAMRNSIETSANIGAHSQANGTAPATSTKGIFVSSTAAATPAPAAASAAGRDGPEPTTAMDVDCGAGPSGGRNGPSAASTSGGEAAGSSSETGTGSGIDNGGWRGAAALLPFALVDEVSDGSPAHAAGLQVGDLLCDFGEVSAAGAPAAAEGGGGGAGQLLQSVAGVLSASEGRPVAARVLRQGKPLELSLTPARWRGRGLLGCHLRPL